VTPEQLAEELYIELTATHRGLIYSDENVKWPRVCLHGVFDVHKLARSIIKNRKIADGFCANRVL
jgi:hypothetical protein